ncbi:hypothetical protein K435DRAFT_697553, partial [Dendrothele bispora CBS 962.96]
MELARQRLRAINGGNDLPWNALLPWQQLAIAVTQMFTLNRKQTLAFLLCVTARMRVRRMDPFRIIIGGPGGTGKSHIYDAIRAWYEQFNFDGELAFTAPTGIAACNIGASTAASFLCLRTEWKQLINPRGVSLRKMIGRLEGVHTFILDEFFFLGCEDFYKISKHLKL